MWIRYVDVPQALIDAHRNGDLVIFVGAGASRESPSDLPLFRKLTEDIADDAKVRVTAEQLERPDVLLGELEDHCAVNVHLRVAARIGTPSTRPNHLHEAIAALASAGPVVRLVTTNYDLHLSTVLAGRGVSVTEYMGPALPMGDDFTGLVYLHGCVRQDPRALVVTDVDFGRAYLRDAWATRFLERMFATYTVLFVGYSHNDVVMNYLARGLGRASARFALTSDPDAAHWRRLRIQPVAYSVVDDSHEALVEALAGWASWASMGLLDHSQRVAQLVSAAPSPVPEEASYLEAVVADSDKVRFFAEHARGAEWLTWATPQPEFRRLFDPLAAPTGCTRPLAYWFAEHYVMDEDLTGTALAVVQQAGGRLGAEVWWAIGQYLHMRKQPRPTWLGPWLVLLTQHAPEPTSGDLLDYALVASRWPEDRVTALLLFDHLTEPQPAFQRSFGLGGAPRFDVLLRGDAHWLKEAWKQLFTPNLATAAPELLGIADRHLRRAHQLLTASGTATPGWDPLSFGRAAIEPHPQDNLRDPVDVLIDAARDCSEALLDAGNELGTSYLHTWAATEIPLLRRLAVHGWTHRNDVDATAKLAWLRRQGWLFDLQLRHEVFRLIATTVVDADPDVADALVADAVTGPDDSEHRDYESFNALAWITRHASGLRSASEELQLLQAAHPDFRERPHPDLLAWMESGFVQPQPPMTGDALHQLIEADPAAAIAELRRYEDSTAPFDGPTWTDALSVLSEVIGDRSADGFAVLDAEGGDHPDIVSAVIRGWAAAPVDDATAESILVRLGSVDLVAAADAVARLLADGRGEATLTAWQKMPASRRLAAQVWAALDNHATDPDATDWLGRAINAPAGRLAEFWVQAVAAEWREVGDDWSGLPAATREQLEILLMGDYAPTAMAEVIFASQLHFFYAADRDWCDRWILPLLDWADPVRARRTWDGFLSWGRWNDQLLAAGLLEQYLTAAKNIATLREEMRRQLCTHLAGIAVSSELDAIPWTRQFTVTVDAPTRTEWMNQVARTLDQLPPDAVEHQWRRWMRRYWMDRLESVPTQLTVEEASAMASWVIYLTDSITDGVSLATSHPARLLQHSHLLDGLTEERIAQAPVAIASLLVHLLRETQLPFYDCYRLREAMRLLRAQPTPPDVTALVEEAVRLGCGDAPTW